MLQFKIALNDGSYLIIERIEGDMIEFTLYDSEHEKQSSGTITAFELGYMGSLIGDSKRG